MAVKHSAPERKIDQERRQAALDALGPNSRRAYDSALRRWWFYTLAADISDPWEPEPSQLREYLLKRADADAGISALRTDRAALVHYQRHARREPTASDPLISDTLAALERNTPPPGRRRPSPRPHWLRSQPRPRCRVSPAAASRMSCAPSSAAWSTSRSAA